MTATKLYTIAFYKRIYFSFLLNPSKHNINEIRIITFNGALLHVSAPRNHHQAKDNKPIANY
jgi:hypothetical protein